MKSILIFCIAILTIGAVEAQNGVVKGTVQNSEGDPQEFANILLVQSTDSSLVKGMVTEIDGKYQFENTSSGSYLIIASLIGYADAYSSIITLNNDVVELPTLILKEGIELDEVTVSAKKPFIELKADKIVVNVENSTVNAGNSAIEILEKSPGVTVDKDNNISLRGKQGVLVMIDGKNQYLSGDELVGILENMPADNIELIEIITNPSSKYDAEGNSGIINIKLKKNTNLGMNGTLSTGARQGRRFSNTNSIDFNYRSSKLNIYGSGSRSDWSGFQDLGLLRVIPFDNGNTTFDQNSDMTFDGVNYNTKLGMDYSISDKTTIGVLYKYNQGDNLWDNNNMTQISGSNAPIFSTLMVHGVNDGLWSQNSGNFNILHNFDDKGTSISFDTDYSVYDRNTDNDYHNSYLNNVQQSVLDPYVLRNIQGTDINIFASKVDFTKSYSGIKLEAGAKLSRVEIDNDTNFEALDNNVWTNQTNRTNNFLYEENVLAFYSNLSKQIGKVSVNAGLRMEHTKSLGNSLTLDEAVERNYTDFFPSLSLSHMLGEHHSLSYSYSKRLNRPNYKDLNPFVEYLDEYTFEKGNPFLNPQYSNAFGINYSFKNAFFVSANYSHTTDAITEVIEQLSEDNQTFQTSVNLDKYNSASLTVSTSIPLKELGVSRINITGFYNDFTSIIPSGTLDNQNLAYNIYVGNEFNLSSDIVFELSGNYRSGLTYGLFEITPEYGLDLGFSKSILKGKGSLKIGVDDVFYTRNNAVQIRQDDINLDVNQRRDSRRVKVNFKYRFGNNKVKSARRRTTATEAESSRIKN